MSCTTFKSILFAIITEIIAFFTLVLLKRGFSLNLTDVLRICASSSMNIILHYDPRTSEQKSLIVPEKYNYCQHLKWSIVTATAVYFIGLKLLEDVYSNTFQPSELTTIYNVLFFITSFVLTFIVCAIYCRQNGGPVSTATKIIIGFGVAKSLIFPCFYPRTTDEELDAFGLAVVTKNYFDKFYPWSYGIGGIGSAIAFYFSIRYFEKTIEDESTKLLDRKLKSENYGAAKKKSSYIAV